MLRKIVLFLIMILFSLILSCHQKSAEVVPKKLTVVATIFPVYDFARNIGGEKIEITMLLPPGIDVHHYELKPVDIVKATQCDIFLFTNFEMENWAYQIIRAASKKSTMLAIETGSGAFLLPVTNHEETADQNTSRFDPHIWLDMDNAKKWWIILLKLSFKRIPVTLIIIGKMPANIK